VSLLLVVRDEDKSAPLLRWAVRLAHGAGDRLLILNVNYHTSTSDGEWTSVDSTWCRANIAMGDVLSSELDNLQILTRVVKGSDAFKTAQSVVKEEKPKLLLTNRNQQLDSDEEVKLVRNLLEHATCAVAVLRLGDTDGKNSKVLIPCGGGPHSKYALRLVQGVEEIQPTAFFVEPDADEVSEDVGYMRLRKIVSRAGLCQSEVNCKVVISDHVSQSIADETMTNEYGMMLHGASDVSTLRRKLFGTVSDKLLRVDDGTAIGVIRSAKPVGHRMRDAFERIVHLSVPQLSRDERIALFGEVEDKSRWSFDFAALMVLATSIASLGLLADSGAVVIGAMLVAPLMMPLLGGGLSLVQGNWPLWRRCQTAVLSGFLSALAIGLLSGLAARALGMALTSELEARGAPNALDLGVAFVSGLAASYCLARPKLSGALAGVAIAAALVPPIATTGIGISLGEMEVAKGAALLFGTNVVAIVFGAALNFYTAGIRGRSGASGLWSKRIFIVFALLCVGLTVPLTSKLISKVTRPVSIVKQLNEVELSGARVITVAPSGRENGVRVMVVRVASPTPLTQAQVKSMHKVLAERYKKGVIMRVRTELVNEVR